jgi:hypothetical protein
VFQDGPFETIMTTSQAQMKIAYCGSPKPQSYRQQASIQDWENGQHTNSKWHREPQSQPLQTRRSINKARRPLHSQHAYTTAKIDVDPHAEKNTASKQLNLRTHDWFQTLPYWQFHILFNSLFKVLFIFPSRYLFTIGLTQIFSLRWYLPPN